MSIALDVGPGTVLRAIRAAFIVNGKLQVIETTDYTAPTDGGGLNIYESVQNGMCQIHSQPESALTMQEDESYKPCNPTSSIPPSTDGIFFVVYRYWTI